MRVTTAELNKLRARTGGTPRTKYHAVKTRCGIHWHPSKKEAQRCFDLRVMEGQGIISGLKFKTRYPIYLNGKHICNYEDDFSYRDGLSGLFIVEDAKGVKTAVYRLKKKLMAACYEIEISET